MRAHIPADYRQPPQIAFGLDLISAIPLGAALFFSLSVLSGHQGAVDKLIEIPGALAVGSFFSFMRWPSEHGDRLHTWAKRAYAYFERERRASLFTKNV